MPTLHKSVTFYYKGQVALTVDETDARFDADLLALVNQDYWDRIAKAVDELHPNHGDKFVKGLKELMEKNHE